MLPRNGVEAIRVMLGAMPAMLRGILEQVFSNQPDMQLVGTSDAHATSLTESVGAARPDVLVVSVERPDWADGLIELFVEHPRLHILAIGDDAREATVHELYVRRCRVADLSPNAIVDAVRTARDVTEEHVAPTSKARH